MNFKYLRLTFFFLITLIGCRHQLDKFGNTNCAFKVSYNPYEVVDWTSWQRCLSQQHDHTSVTESRIRAYDEAGYQAVPLMHYSGVQSLEYTSRERLWPLSEFLKEYPSDEAFLETTQNLKFFIPSMEEVGRHHMTSPFLTTYLELWERNFSPNRQVWNYFSNQNLIDKIIQFGGLPIIAHPTEKLGFYRKLNNFNAIEIYNAFFDYRFRTGEFRRDQNQHFLEVWDDLLTYKSTKIFGYAVNDWYGPYNLEVKESHPQTYDSGKTLVMLETYSLESYRRSLEAGAFFAIKDHGFEKGLYPQINKIEVDEQSITLEVTDGEVNWSFCGEVIQQGLSFDLSHLPHNLNYIRAEVVNENSTIYIQPFSLTEVDHKITD